MPAKKQRLLSLAVIFFGRWARYEIIEKCWLPIAKSYAFQTCGLYENLRQETYTEFAVAEPFEWVREGRATIKRANVINWRSEPSHGMRPINWPAKIIFWFAGPDTRWIAPPKYDPKDKMQKRAKELNWAETMYDFVDTDEAREIRKEMRERWKMEDKRSA